MPRIGNAGQANSRTVHQQRGVIASIVIGYDHRPLPGKHGVQADQPLHAAAGHDTGLVIVLKDKVALGGTGRQDDRACPDLEQIVAPLGGQQVVLVQCEDTCVR